MPPVNQLNQMSNMRGGQINDPNRNKDVPVIDPGKEAVDSDDKPNKKLVSRLRAATLAVMPAVVINNASNFIGLFDTGADVLMLKASGLTLLPKEKRGKWYNWITEPPKNIYKAILLGDKGNPVFPGLTVDNVKNPAKWQEGLSKLPSGTAKALNPVNWWRGLKDMGDVDKATEIFNKRGVKIQNKWLARSTAASFVSMTFLMFLPDSGESKEEIEDNAKMAKDKPLQYASMRIKHAVWVPDWFQGHTREFAGLGKFGAGFFSFLSGFRDIHKFENGTRAFRQNRMYQVNSAITMLAGSRLLMGKDNEQAWNDYGKTILTRTVFLPFVLGRKAGLNYDNLNKADGWASLGGQVKNLRWRNIDDSNKWYIGAKGAFLIPDGMSFLIGGAEKLPDGTIVDKKAIREAADKEAHAKGYDTIFDAPAQKTHKETGEIPKKQVVEVSEHARQAEKEAALSAAE